jgi:predicted RNA-binding Zn ribbon-like protein
MFYREAVERTTPSPVPGESTSPALALVNTRFLRQGAEVDLLANARESARWLTERHLLPRGQPLGPGELNGLRALRSAVRDLFESRIDDRTPRPGSVDAVNRALAHAPVAVHLAWPRRGGPQAAWEVVGPDATVRAAAVIALDAVEVLTDARCDRLARCDAHGCIRLFAREHARRRWCSTRCGARVRAARHQARAPLPAGAGRAGRPPGVGVNSV